MSIGNLQIDQLHHLKELTAIIDYISEETMVVVDDAPIFVPMKIENNKYHPITEKTRTKSIRWWQRIFGK